MSEPLVHIEDFRMVFGDTTVIEDLSFDVHAGETFGFLGSNWSGKTATLHALLRIYQSTAGTLHIGGKTIMNTPQLLILDEPTKGFDPVNRRLLMDIIDDQRRAGATVVMVTHQVEEVERLCDRVILLQDGTSHAYGTVREVQEQFGGTTYRVTRIGTLPASRLYTVLGTQQMGETQLSHLASAEGTTEAAVLAQLVGSGVPVYAFTPVRTSLEEIFLRVYGPDSLHDAGVEPVGVGA